MLHAPPRTPTFFLKPNYEIYNASAGSGKTFALASRYLATCLGSNEEDFYRRILALTFTNKASEEMKSRILSSLKEFSKKIYAGKKSSSSDLMIIARIESLILDKPISDALKRADSYIDSGADGIMIHSKDKDPKEVLAFAEKFKKNYSKIPLVVVPSSFNIVKESQLIDYGFNIVIYANHMLRASYPAMRKTALDILKYGRSHEIDKSLLSIKEILELIPGTK